MNKIISFPEPMLPRIPGSSLIIPRSAYLVDAAVVVAEVLAADVAAAEVEAALVDAVL